MNSVDLLRPKMIEVSESFFILFITLVAISRILLRLLNTYVDELTPAIRDVPVIVRPISAVVFNSSQNNLNTIQLVACCLLASDTLSRSLYPTGGVLSVLCFLVFIASERERERGYNFE